MKLIVPRARDSTTLQKLRKLRKMSWHEVATRVREKLRTRSERRLVARGASDGFDPESLERVAAGLATRAQRFVPGCARDEVLRLREEHPGLFDRWKRHVVDRAERVLNGTTVLLGRTVDLSGRVNWHQDPVTGYCWPTGFYGDVTVVDLPDGADVKFVWEVNRHQFLVDLGIAWLLAGDQRYAARARFLLLDWIDQNPLYRGVNWTSSLEVAVRAVSWLWTLAALKESDVWAHEDLFKIARSLGEHATFLSNHLSLYSSPYNHLVGEGTGLLLLGWWLGGLSRAADWVELGSAILAKHGPRQFHGDGFCVEQASGYHFFSLGLLVLAAVAARVEGKPIREVERALPAAFRAGAALRQPDGRWPAIGDVDSARAIPLVPEDFWDFRSFLSLGVELFELRELKDTTAGPGAELYFLRGVGGIDGWHEAESESGPSLVVLPESGYAAARAPQEQGDDWLLFDCGPIAHGLFADATASVAHGHADALQILLFQRGQPILVDCGMPSYNAPLETVDSFREACAHNTIELDGAPVAKPAGRLGWSHVCERFRLDANLSERAWLLRGRLEPVRAVALERCVLGIPGLGVWIADRVRTDRPRRLRWYWQLAAGCPPRLEEAGETHTFYRHAQGVLISWSSAGPLRSRVVTAKEGDPAAWVSPGYGIMEPGCRIAHEVRVESELLVSSYIGERYRASFVKVGRHSLHGAIGQDVITRLGEIPADVVWSIASEGGVDVFAAGTACHPPPGGTSLSGAGSWPAWHLHIPGHSDGSDPAPA